MKPTATDRINVAANRRIPVTEVANSIKIAEASRALTANSKNPQCIFLSPLPDVRTLLKKDFDFRRKAKVS